MRDATAVDLFTLEILQDAFSAICDEMFAITQRTSQSTIIYEVLDLAVGLTDAEGNLITQGQGVPGFLGQIDQAVVEIIDKFGLAHMAEGDIFLTNDVYGGGGTHLSDVAVIMPIFFADEVVAFAGNKAHWPEVGGKDPGSVSTDATEVFQEGLQFPYIKLFDRAAPNDAVLDLIRANVRVPDASIGDLYSQVASVRLAARRFGELCERYGVNALKASIDRMSEQSAEQAALEVAKLPPGTYTAEDLLHDGSPEGPYPIRVTVTVTPTSVVCDFAGTHPQLATPMNCSRSTLIAAARVIFKAVVGPKTPLTAGSFRQLKVVCPPRTIFTAERPAPTSEYYEVQIRAADLVWQALAPVIPGRLPAGHFSSVGADLIVGDHPDTGELFILFEPTAGGWGAGAGIDGARGVFCLSDGDTYAVPVEVAESKYGVMVDRYCLNVTGAGAGEWRGGEGTIRDYRLTAAEGTVTGYFSRHDTFPWGVAGGLEGSRNEWRILPADGGSPVIERILSRRPLRKNDVVRIVTGTGGGWGDPLNRDPELVASDVRNEFVTIDQAEQVYGVLIEPETFAVRGLTPKREQR